MLNAEKYKLPTKYKNERPKASARKPNPSDQWPVAVSWTTPSLCPAPQSMGERKPKQEQEEKKSSIYYFSLWHPSHPSPRCLIRDTRTQICNNNYNSNNSSNNDHPHLKGRLKLEKQPRQRQRQRQGKSKQQWGKGRSRGKRRGVGEEARVFRILEHPCTPPKSFAFCLCVKFFFLFWNFSIASPYRTHPHTHTHRHACSNACVRTCTHTHARTLMHNRRRRIPATHYTLGNKLQGGYRC